ncbi:ribonuclease D [Actinobacteria bacterium IMCC25003]|nr:ribonuclease D [Actinobacteria bacterium IMCC25003]
MELPPLVQHVAVADEELPAATPLLRPADGIPAVIDTEAAFDEAISQLSKGTGPFAFDAERASGYKYSARAYLIQIKRTGGGLHLIDPIPFGPGHRCFTALNELIQGVEVILHASTQDLPCLREVGIYPNILFDTELGGRIAGLPRVGLGPLLETLLGVSLAKEHSAVDWSTRPLPQDWLNYAALDVELLVELRDKVYQLLVDGKKWKWAEEDFASIISAPPPPPRIDPWRRTSGMHKIKKRNHMAVIRELWQARNELAQELDISPSRLLSDAAISEIALASDKGPITNRKHLEKILRPLGLRARWLENAATWISCISDAIAMPEDQWPETRSKSDAMPPIKIWRERFPEKYAPLTHARFNLQVRAEELSIPLENMISPELVRRICWQPPELSVQEALLAMGARRWQAEIAAPILEQALTEREPLEVPEPATEPDAPAEE